MPASCALACWYSSVLSHTPGLYLALSRGPCSAKDRTWKARPSQAFKAIFLAPVFTLKISIGSDYLECHQFLTRSTLLAVKIDRVKKTSNMVSFCFIEKALRYTRFLSFKHSMLNLSGFHMWVFCVQHSSVVWFSFRIKVGTLI